MRNEYNLQTLSYKMIKKMKKTKNDHKWLVLHPGNMGELIAFPKPLVALGFATKTLKCRMGHKNFPNF